MAHSSSLILASNTPHQLSQPVSSSSLLFRRWGSLSRHICVNICISAPFSLEMSEITGHSPAAIIYEDVHFMGYRNKCVKSLACSHNKNHFHQIPLSTFYQRVCIFYLVCICDLNICFTVHLRHSKKDYSYRKQIKMKCNSIPKFRNTN